MANDRTAATENYSKELIAMIEQMVSIQTQPLQQRIEELEKRVATLEHRAGPMTTTEMMQGGNISILGNPSSKKP